MGNIAAIVVGIISFFVALMAGNVLGGIAFGAVMYAMAYGAFVWRPGKAADKTGADSVTPTQIGAALGASLVADHNPSEVVEKELAFVTAANIPRAAYVLERFVLNACAAAFSVSSYVPSRYRGELQLGLVNWLEQTAVNIPGLRECAHKFRERYPVYREAGERDASSAAEPGVFRISQVSGVFGDALLSHTFGDAATGGLCQILSMTVSDVHWAARVQGSTEFLQRASSLLPSDAD